MNHNDAIISNEVKSIYIPSFKIEKENCLEFKNNNENNENKNYLIENMKNILIENFENSEEKNQKFSLNSIEQNYKMSFKFNKDYDKNLQINFNEENDILIENKFLMAVINLDIMEDTRISTIFLDIVDKEFWEKI